MSIMLSFSTAATAALSTAIQTSTTIADAVSILGEYASHYKTVVHEDLAEEREVSSKARTTRIHYRVATEMKTISEARSKDPVLDAIMKELAAS